MDGADVRRKGTFGLHGCCCPAQADAGGDGETSLGSSPCPAPPLFSPPGPAPCSIGAPRSSSWPRFSFLSREVGWGIQPPKLGVCTCLRALLFPPSSSIWRPPLTLGARLRGLPSPAGSSAKLVSRALGSNEVSRLIGQDSTTSTQASAPVGAAPASVGLAFGGSSSSPCLRWAPV